jgi:hypothetical protein
MNWLTGRLLLAWLDSRLRWVGPAGIGGRSSSLRFFFSSLSSVTDDPVPLVDIPLFLWLVDPACQRLGGSAASLGSATRRSWVCRRGVDAPVVVAARAWSCVLGSKGMRRSDEAGTRRRRATAWN